MNTIKSARQSRNLTIRDLANKTGFSFQYISHIENGERGAKLPVPTAKRIAEALNVDWTEFYDSDTDESK